MTVDVAGRVKQTVEDALTAGCVLRTPDDFKGTEFQVMSVDSLGIKVSKLTTLITWKELESAVGWLRECGRSGQGYERKIGARQESDVSGDTLEGCLRKIGGTQMKSSYVASILGKAGIVMVYGGRPNSITLAPDWR